MGLTEVTWNILRAICTVLQKKLTDFEQCDIAIEYFYIVTTFPWSLRFCIRYIALY